MCDTWFCVVVILFRMFIILYMFLVFFFFFSSRRRHTRYWRDWSSDVCSSDLEFGAQIHLAMRPATNRLLKTIHAMKKAMLLSGVVAVVCLTLVSCSSTPETKIGRASCRERV